MSYYDKFKEKIKNTTTKTEGINKFGLNYRKRVVWASTGISLIIAAILFPYAFRGQYNLINWFTMGTMFFGLCSLYMLFDYKIVVNFEEKKIEYKKVNIDFDNIEKIKIEKIVPPGWKKMSICASIITKEKTQLIIPLMMNSREKFVSMLREINRENFYME